MLEIPPDLRFQAEIKRQGVENVGNERGGAAEGFGEDVAVPEEDIVAVITDDEDGVIRGLILRILDGRHHGGGEKGESWEAVFFSGH